MAAIPSTTATTKGRSTSRRENGVELPIPSMDEGLTAATGLTELVAAESTSRFACATVGLGADSDSAEGVGPRKSTPATTAIARRNPSAIPKKLLASLKQADPP